jgi:hypothetical protein
MSRDGSTPEKQAAQIMAIYPIVKGQKFSKENMIPPRASPSGQSTQSKEPASDGGDLIDFGDDGSPYDTPQSSEQSLGEKPPLEPSHKSTSEIQKMLASTGTGNKEGPLIDFHNDMEKSLPSSVKRADSENESQDEFVDAQD